MQEKQITVAQRKQIEEIKEALEEEESEFQKVRMTIKRKMTRLAKKITPEELVRR